MRTIGIIGLGYVGYPLALLFADKNTQVIGFDVDKSKVDSLRAGKSYIKHINQDRLKKNLDRGTFHPTGDFTQVAKCDAVLISVPTPLDQHLEPNLEYIIDTCKTIAPHLKSGVLVSLESTTWPGTTREVVMPLLEEGSNLKVGTDLYLAFSPEREDPGNPNFHTGNIPKLVGGIDEASLEKAVAIYKLAIENIVPLSCPEVAEATKLFENIFRSINIALVNELKIIFDKMNIDVWEVIKAASTKPFGFMPFWPGPGLGGHCIPIDPFYLTWKAKEFGINTRFIELAGEINRSMPQFVVSKVQDCLNESGKALRAARVLILGLSYKPDIDDMRESPSLELMRLMEEKGAHVHYHDPHISRIGENRGYKQFVGRQSQPLSNDYDCFIFATQHSDFSANKILSFGVPVVDTRNALPKNNNVYRA